MTARPAFPAVSGAATFQDIRRSFTGMVETSAAGALRTGILPSGTGQLITGTASMVVNVQTCVIVLDRNGAIFLPNDGVHPVQLSSAPSSGSRWSIVYAKQRESEAPFSDGATGPLIDKVESTTSEDAARTLLPAGARELGVWKVDAGATTTNASNGVTYTETVPYTAMEGGVVLLRNATEQAAWAPADGSQAYRLDLQRHTLRVNGQWDEVDAASVTVFGAGFNPFSSSGWDGLRYWRRGRVVYVNGAVQKDAAGGWAAGTAFANLPEGFRPSRKWQGVNCEILPGGNLVTINSGNANGAFGLSASFPL